MINLFINWFDHPRRGEEFEYCLKKNEENKRIDRIIKYDSSPGRATYNDFFRLMEKYPKDINIIANLDIYFDDSVYLANRIGLNECWALTRWEQVKVDCPACKASKKLNGRACNSCDHNGQIDKVIYFDERHNFNKNCQSKWSQDAWIFRGSPPTREANFELGIPGCDNRIASILNGCGIAMKNPSYTIKAIHLHKQDTRDYEGMQRLPGKLFPVQPCYLD